jgi:hypothetical protein
MMSSSFAMQQLTVAAGIIHTTENPASLAMTVRVGPGENSCSNFLLGFRLAERFIPRSKFHIVHPGRLPHREPVILAPGVVAPPPYQGYASSRLLLMRSCCCWSITRCARLRRSFYMKCPS